MNLPADGFIICNFGDQYALVELRNHRVAGYLYSRDYNRLVATYHRWATRAVQAHKKRIAPFWGYYDVELDDLLSAPQEAVPAGS